MYVFDDVLTDPAAYRAAVLRRPFQTVTFGPDLAFHGIQLAEDDPAFVRWIGKEFPDLVPTLSFFRQSPAGQIEPNFVHTDRDMGDWTALLYLNPDPAAGDGTTFWRHLPTGAIASESNDLEARLAEQAAWHDVTQWALVAHVAAAFGRAVLFRSGLFHSRAIVENYGAGDDARLIQVVFGLGTLRKD